MRPGRRPEILEAVENLGEKARKKRKAAKIWKKNCLVGLEPTAKK
jgi:hypothetical protein